MIQKKQLDLINSGVLDNLGEDLEPTLTDELPDVLVKIAQYLCDQLRDSATKKAVVATKELRSGIDTSDASTSGSVVEVSILMPDQWKYAEYGRKKGKRPPVKAIEEWITAKGIPVKRTKTQTTLQVRHGMAIAIAKKIGQKGTIKRFKYKGSGFIKAVMTKQNMKIISQHLAELAGRKIELYFKVK